MSFLEKFSDSIPEENVWDGPRGNISETEETLKDLFHEDVIKNEDDFNAAATEVFNAVCGDEGREEFFGFVLPAIRSVYGENYRKAGLRILDILDAAAEQPRKKIGEYLKAAVSDQEIAFSKRDKGEIWRMVESAIDGLILEERLHPREGKGVVAVIVFGSYARNIFHANSDLDLVEVTAEKKKEDFDEPEQTSLYDVEKFEQQLGRRVKDALGISVEIHNVIDPAGAGIAINETQRLEGVIGTTNFRIVTPYPEIKTRLEGILSPKQDS